MTVFIVNVKKVFFPKSILGEPCFQEHKNEHSKISTLLDSTAKVFMKSFHAQRLKPATLLKVTLLHGCFARF